MKDELKELQEIAKMFWPDRSFVDISWPTLLQLMLIRRLDRMIELMEQKK